MKFVRDSERNTPFGIIGSSGGSALSAAVDCLSAAGMRAAFVVVADRECGLLEWARRKNHATTLLSYSSAEQFSGEALAAFESAGVRHALLFYTRRVAEPLIHKMMTWNIHPSLLPAFPGMGCLNKALAAGVRMLGATLHRVNEAFDAGPIYAQTACALPTNTCFGHTRTISFLQKTWLTLIWHEIASRSQILTECTAPAVNLDFPAPINAYPSLRDQRLITAFDQLQKQEGCRVIDIRSA